MGYQNTLNKFLHSLHNDFDRDVPTETMTFDRLEEHSSILTKCLPIQKVDVICFKASQAVCNSGSDMMRLVSDLAATIWRDEVPKFGGQEYLQNN